MAIEILDNIRLGKGSFGTVGIEVRDKNGLITQSWEQPLDSLVENWWRWWRGVMLVNQDSNSRRISDGALATISGTTLYQFHGDAGIDYMGILAGIGTTAVAIGDWDLANRVTQGTGPGQMEYAAIHRPSSSSLNSDRETVTLTRVLSNNSGNIITIREVGASAAPFSTSNADSTRLFARDVLAQEAEVPSGGAITIRYTFRYQDGIQASLWPIFRCAANSSIGLTDVSGTTTNISNLNGGTSGIDGWRHNNGTNVGRGIRLGSGSTTPEAWDNYTWDQLIGLGSADGNLWGEANSFSGWTVDNVNNEMEMEVERLFSNMGDVDVNVREIMIRGIWRYAGTSSTIDCLSYRRLTSEPVLFYPGRSDFFRFKIRYSL